MVKHWKQNREVYTPSRINRNRNYDLEGVEECVICFVVKENNYHPRKVPLLVSQWSTYFHPNGVSKLKIILQKK